MTVSDLWLFLTVQWVRLPCVILVFPDLTHFFVVDDQILKHLPFYPLDTILKMLNKILATVEFLESWQWVTFFLFPNLVKIICKQRIIDLQLSQVIICKTLEKR